MVKLEASLAEMERELTRAEAAHMRERRELLDREAAAVADQERFRSRSILLQGEVSIDVPELRGAVVGVFSFLPLEGSITRKHPLMKICSKLYQEGENCVRGTL